MPKNMSEEFKQIIKKLGIDLIEVGDGDFDSAIEKKINYVNKKDILTLINFIILLILNVIIQQHVK